MLLSAWLRHPTRTFRLLQPGSNLLPSQLLKWNHTFISWELPQEDRVKMPAKVGGWDFNFHILRSNQELHSLCVCVGEGAVFPPCLGVMNGCFFSSPAWLGLAAAALASGENEVSILFCIVWCALIWKCLGGIVLSNQAEILSSTWKLECIHSTSIY